MLAPSEGALLAYRLLAHSMQVTHRAGMATLVMRGREYVVALTSARGVIRMATLRFHDELRSPDEIGLPELETASVANIESMRAAMERLEKSGIALSELEDKGDKRLLALVDRKVKEGEDVFQVDNQDVGDHATADDEAVDIMERLRRSLAQGLA